MTVCARLAVFAVVFALAVSLGVYSLHSGIRWEASIKTVGFWPWSVAGVDAAGSIALVGLVIGVLLTDPCVG